MIQQRQQVLIVVAYSIVNLLALASFVSMSFRVQHRFHRGFNLRDAALRLHTRLGAARDLSVVDLSDLVADMASRGEFAVVFGPGGETVHLDTFDDNFRQFKVQGARTTEHNVGLYKTMKNEESHTFGNIIRDQYRILHASKAADDKHAVIVFVFSS